MTENFKVILISGKQGSGKSSLSAALTATLIVRPNLIVHQSKFAAPLYKMHRAIRSILATDGMDNLPAEFIDGPLLQVLGTEWGRKTRGEDFWKNYAVRSVKNRIYELAEMGMLTNHTAVFIFDDCRFPNELEAFPGKSFKVRLQAEEEVRKARADKWRPNTNHPSEVGLDNAEFDLSIRTDTRSSDETLQAVLDHLQDAWDNLSKPNISTTEAK